MSKDTGHLVIGKDIARVVRDDDGIHYIERWLQIPTPALWIGGLQRDVQDELLGQDKEYIECQYKTSSFYMHRADAISSLIQDEKRFLLGFERRSKHSDASRERLAHLEQVLEKEIKGGSV